MWTGWLQLPGLQSAAPGPPGQKVSSTPGPSSVHYARSATHLNLRSALLPLRPLGLGASQASGSAALCLVKKQMPSVWLQAELTAQQFSMVHPLPLPLTAPPVPVPRPTTSDPVRTDRDSAPTYCLWDQSITYESVRRLRKCHPVLGIGRGGVVVGGGRWKAYGETGVG